ncbi:recombinase family protein [Leisingera sp. JC11]|uniref:recombinase family protein n=1 Tax=Leisingera sp. JC11 TaxID=3042469 RepID=UPI00345705A7
MKRYVIYRRVSTEEQGKSGLGLEAQHRDIALFLENFSEEPYEVIGEFEDHLSGKHDERPQLAAALELVRKTGAELLVAKLDRLSRKVSFIATLMDDPKVKLRVASMPSADKFQLHIYAALAEQEREFISARTKAALAEAKAKGVKLGGLRDKTMKRNEVVKANARARAEKVAQTVQPLRAQGASLRQIAEALNASGVPTARGGRWQASQVKRVLERLQAVG